MHESKIFTVRFNPVMPNLLYSGSWDNSVKFWDVRSNKSTHSLARTNVIGDSVDMMRDLNTVVTSGGGSLGASIFLWDLRKSQKPYETIAWS